MLSDFNRGLYVVTKLPDCDDVASLLYDESISEGASLLSKNNVVLFVEGINSFETGKDPYGNSLLIKIEFGENAFLLNIKKSKFVEGGNSSSNTNFNLPSLLSGGVTFKIFLERFSLFSNLISSNSLPSLEGVLTSQVIVVKSNPESAGSTPPGNLELAEAV